MVMDLEQTFGQQIKSRRKMLGLTQAQFAELCGLDRKYLGLVEKGSGNPSLRTIAKISDVLKVQPRDLMSDIDSRSDN